MATKMKTVRVVPQRVNKANLFTAVADREQNYLGN